ncbi:hypothetical protein BU26DRAFT_164254 [Trematosphaeria pertusa]|uniref:Uncharacterized protein n=1 Tax=Trematosphaeria pertusa TaxID=390896 RepID=A0A6A6HV24_9PLEO|nr:uncharacterized protein BU26DRAFT_164254 [Trematosphaeria pertusa]KAF2242045.1 hypothetical protein BU26DRAFT_164254 [Trematosphaeria pertusa]
MASARSSSSPFLALPSSIRQRIYAHLLAPHPDDDVTTINYTLEWPWLEHPSNTTFAGIQQIDLCRCPREHHPRTHNVRTEDHIYVRYKCVGPEVRFKSSREDLWVLSPASYANPGPINFLRPASQEELGRRPHASVLATCKMVYREAVPLLYRGRNFLFLSGPCPRGRYQAYATQAFFSRLSHFAREHVTMFSLIAQPHEEDCSAKDVVLAYANLANFAQHYLPSFETLCLNLWDERLGEAARMFGILLREGVVSVCVARDPVQGDVEECEDLEGFLESLGFGTDVEGTEEELVMRGEEVVEMGEGTSITTSWTGTVHSRHAGPVWEEVQEGDDAGEWEDEEDEDMPQKPEVRTEVHLRKVSKVQRVLSKSRKKPNLREECDTQVEAEEEEEGWVDAMLSPTTPMTARSRDTEGWEVV